MQSLCRSSIRGATPLLGLLALVSCGAFRGYQKLPDPSSHWEAPGPSGSSSSTGSRFSAYLYQPEAQRREIFKGSLSTLSALFANETFRERVRREKGWITNPACEDSESGELAVTGDDVVRSVLDGDFRDVHYFANPNFNSNANTVMCPSRTSIDPERVDQWTHKDAAVRADYLNTLAHELTHLVPTSRKCNCTDSNPCLMQFTDRGHDSCTDGYLVSYHLGDMVECHYLHSDNDTAFQKCLRDLRPKAQSAECKNDVQQLVETCRKGHP